MVRFTSGTKILGLALLACGCTSSVSGDEHSTGGASSSSGGTSSTGAGGSGISGGVSASGGASAGTGAATGAAPGGGAAGGSSPAAGGMSGNGGSISSTAGTSNGDAGAPAQNGEPGVWQEVSPIADVCGDGTNFGFQAIDGAMPDARGTLYVGTDLHGIQKTTDGGDSWVKIDTGPGSETLDTGRNWSLMVDVTDSNTVYAVSGYSSAQGIWKSTDGGVNWVNVGIGLSSNDMLHLAPDALQHEHIVATGHSAPDHIYETFDGGDTWTTHDPPWGLSATFIYILDRDDEGNPSSDYWIGFTEAQGLWRTTTGGRIDDVPSTSAWTQVSATLSRSHAGAGLYRAKNGALYGGMHGTIGRSSDNGKTWEDLHVTGNLPSSCDEYAGMVGDGESIWAMRVNTGHAACGPYYWWTTPEDGDGRTWTQFPQGPIGNGPHEPMKYDPENHIIYASQWCTGVWRYKLP